MRFHIASGLLLVLLSQPTSAQELSIVAAAARHVPGVVWRKDSVVVGDFTCRGRTEEAILGTSQSEIVIAVFLNGLHRRPEALRYSALARDPASATLETESLDYDPMAELGQPLPGFRSSKRCTGLNLSDGKIDSAHIYWNHDARRFHDWVR